MYIYIYIYKKKKIFIYIYIYIYKDTEICIYTYIHAHIFASISRKWKIFHQCLLIPQSRKTELIFFIPKACNFIKKETLTQVFSSEFRKISKNIFFYRTPPVAASVYIFVSLLISWKIFHQSNLPLNSGKNGVIFLISVRFDFISTKWKAFHRCHLFPWNAKKLRNFL